MAEAKVLAPLTPTYRVSLDYLGEQWREAYIELRDLPWSQTRSLQKQSETITDDKAEAFFTTAFKTAFVSGKVPASDGSMIDLTVDMLTADNFSLAVLGEIFQYVIGGMLPKASMRSATSTKAAQPSPRMI